jgi:hypothetical protein
MATIDVQTPATFPRTRVSSEMRRLVNAFLQCSPSCRESLLTKSHAAIERDPRTDPAFTDRLMASAGGAAALYRQVVAVLEGTVHYTYSNRPFGRDKHGECTLKAWRKWAQRAVVQRRSSIELYVHGYGWALHEEILEANLLASSR